MTYKRHPMNKHINAPRRRPRPTLAHAMRIISRGMSAYASAAFANVSRAFANVSRQLRGYDTRSAYVLTR